MYFCCNAVYIVWLNIVYAFFEIQQNCAFTTVVFFTMVVNFTMNYNGKNTSNFNVTRGMNGNRIQSLHSRFTTFVQCLTTLYYASCQAFPVVSYPDPQCQAFPVVSYPDPHADIVHKKICFPKRSITNHIAAIHALQYSVFF